LFIWPIRVEELKVLCKGTCYTYYKNQCADGQIYWLTYYSYFNTEHITTIKCSKNIFDNERK